MIWHIRRNQSSTDDGTEGRSNGKDDMDEVWTSDRIILDVLGLHRFGQDVIGPQIGLSNEKIDEHTIVAIESDLPASIRGPQLNGMHQIHSDGVQISEGDRIMEHEVKSVPVVTFLKEHFVCSIPVLSRDHELQIDLWIC